MIPLKFGVEGYHIDIGGIISMMLISCDTIYDTVSIMPFCKGFGSQLGASRRIGISKMS